MAKKELNYTQIPNIILDDTHLNVYEFRIIMHIARQTIGYGKKSDGISLSQFVKATGMGVSKVKTTIRELKARKHIKITQQTAKHGGKSYNRYSLTLSHHTTYHSHDTTNPRSPHDQGVSHDTAIQKKIDKREEREYPSNNIYFSIFGNELKKEVHSFVNELSMNASNENAYKAKLRKQLEKKHPETLAVFEEWYLNSKCEKLVRKYKGKEYLGNPIVSIHNYLDTEGFRDTDKFIIQTKDSKGVNRTECFSTFDDVESELVYTVGE